MNKKKVDYVDNDYRNPAIMFFLILLFTILGVLSSSCATHSATAYNAHRSCAAYD